MPTINKTHLEKSRSLRAPVLKGNKKRTYNEHDYWAQYKGY